MTDLADQIEIITSKLNRLRGLAHMVEDLVDDLDHCIDEICDDL